MMEMKIYVCAKCEADKFSKWFKGKVFRGTRKDVRKHLREEHFIKKALPMPGALKKPKSNLSLNTIAEQYNPTIVKESTKTTEGKNS